MSFVRAVTRAAANTSTGNQDFTTTDLGGLTPKAAIVIMTKAITDGTAANDAALSIGATDGTRQWVLSTFDENGTADSDTYRHFRDDALVYIMDGTGAADGIAVFVSFIADGIRINWTDAPAGAYLVQVELFAGTDLSVYAGTASPNGTLNAATDITAPNFEPDNVFMASGGSTVNTLTAALYAAVGIAKNDGGGAVTQHGWFWNSADAAAAENLEAILSTLYSTGQIDSGAYLWAGEVDDFDSQGFSVYTRVNNTVGTDVFGYLALKYNGVVSTWVGTVDSPTATGSDSETGPGFRPQHVLEIATLITAVDTFRTNAQCGSTCFNSFDADDEFSTSVTAEDAAVTMNTQSLSDNTAVNLPLDTGATAHIATFTSFDATGYTRNFTTANGTLRKWIGWAISETAASSSSSSSSSTSSSSTSSSSTSSSSTSSSSSSTSVSSSSSSSSSSTSISTPPTLTVTTPSFHRSLGLSPVISDPLFFSTRTFSRRLTGLISAYSHEIRSIGGYWQASITLTDSIRRLEDWASYGLGRHLQVYNPSLVEIWEGFVNQINIIEGGEQFSIGPLIDVGNRLKVSYSPVNADVVPPVVGVNTSLAVGNNTDSQALHGIWEKLQGVNQVTATEATQLRDMFLNDPTRAYPDTSLDSSLTGGGDLTVEIQCLGYWHFLTGYYYTNTAVTGYESATTKIQNVLTAAPNAGVFSTDYSQIATNATLVKKYEGGDKTAETILKEINGLGDSSNNPYTIGFYQNRQLFYQPLPSAIAYQRRATGNRGIVNQVNREVMPWDVLPARWIFRPDFLVGRFPPITTATLGTDPRAAFIEVVSFQAPYGLSINGRKLSQIDQVLARRGLGGAA